MTRSGDSLLGDSLKVTNSRDKSKKEAKDKEVRPGDSVLLKRDKITLGSRPARSEEGQEEEQGQEHLAIQEGEEPAQYQEQE